MASQVEKDGNTLMIDGGDSLQGTPFVQYYREHQQECKALLADGKGGFFHPVAEAFRALGCDYFTLGNHDFNFGYDFLSEYVNAMVSSVHLCKCRGSRRKTPDSERGCPRACKWSSRRNHRHRHRLGQDLGREKKISNF